MTSHQKTIISKLLSGHHIVSNPGRILLRDAAGNPVLKVSARTFYFLQRNYLRKQKGLFLVNLNKVRQLHGNSMAKRLYKGKVSPVERPKSPPHNAVIAFGGRQSNKSFLTLQFLFKTWQN